MKHAYCGSLSGAVDFSPGTSARCLPYVGRDSTLMQASTSALRKAILVYYNHGSTLSLERRRGSGCGGHNHQPPPSVFHKTYKCNCDCDGEMAFRRVCISRMALMIDLRPRTDWLFVDTSYGNRFFAYLLLRVYPSRQSILTGNRKSRSNPVRDSEMIQARFSSCVLRWT